MCKHRAEGYLRDVTERTLEANLHPAMLASIQHLTSALIPTFKTQMRRSLVHGIGYTGVPEVDKRLRTVRGPETFCTIMAASPKPLHPPLVVASLKDVPYCLKVTVRSSPSLNHGGFKGQ